MIYFFFYIHLEANRLAVLRSYGDVRRSIDPGARRSMSTTVELTPDQAEMTSENVNFGRELPRLSLTPLAHSKTSLIR